MALILVVILIYRLQSPFTSLILPIPPIFLFLRESVVENVVINVCQ